MNTFTNITSSKKAAKPNTARQNVGSMFGSDQPVSTVPKPFDSYMTALTVFGLACYFTTGQLLFSPSLWMQPSQRALETISAVSPLSWCIGLLMLAGFALLSQRLGSLYTHRALVIGSGAIYTLGSILVFLGDGGPSFVPGFLVAGTVLQAIYSCLILFWAEVLCNTSIPKIATMLCCGYVLANGLAMLLAANVGPLSSTLIHVLPLISMLILSLFSEEEQETVARDKLSFKSLPIKQYLAVGVFGAAQLMITAISELRFNYSVELNSVTGGLCFAILMLIVIAISRKLFNIVTFYRLLVPSLILAMLVVLVAESGTQIYEPYMIGGVYVAFRVFTVCLWCYYAMNTVFPTAYVVAAGQIVLLICNKIEKVVAPIILPSDHLTLAILAIIIICLVAALFLMNETGFQLPTNTDRKIRLTFGSLDDYYTECVERAAEQYHLTVQERKICLLVLQNNSTDVISEQLFISPATLKTHMRNIYGKLSVHTRSELVTALRDGLTIENEA